MKYETHKSRIPSGSIAKIGTIDPILILTMKNGSKST